MSKVTIVSICPGPRGVKLEKSQANGDKIVTHIYSNYFSKGGTQTFCLFKAQMLVPLLHIKVLRI